MAIGYNFYSILFDASGNLRPMPEITISKRETDITVKYNKNFTRVDRIAEEIYQNPNLWRLIMWANPDYFVEFDIPDNTIIRVPYPLNPVLDEVVRQIQVKSKIG